MQERDRPFASADKSLPAEAKDQGMGLSPAGGETIENQ